MVKQEYLNDRQTIILKELESEQECTYSGETLETDEFAIGFNYNEYESRAVWVSIDHIVEFSKAVNEFFRTDGESSDGEVGIFLARSNDPPDCDICGEPIEDLRSITIENDDPRYAMWLHKNEDCINQFQNDLNNLKSNMHLVIPNKL